MIKQFGGKLTRELLERYQKSPQWREGKFQNAEMTNMDIGLKNMPKLLYKQFFKTKGRAPQKPIIDRSNAWSGCSTYSSIQI